MASNLTSKMQTKWVIPILSLLILLVMTQQYANLILNMAKMQHTINVRSQRKLVANVQNESQGANTLDCPTGPIVTVEDGGRLANKIWEYAAVWSMAQFLDRPGFVPQTLLEDLKEIFDKLSLHSLSEIEHCKLELGNPVIKKTLLPLDEVKETFKGQHMLLQKYILFPEPILQFRNHLKNTELRFRPEILREVEATVESVGGKNLTRIGIHVRRTDFDQYLKEHYKTSLVGRDFFKKSMQWFRANVTGPLLFLIVSDDVKWCKSHLIDSTTKDIVFVSKSPAHDLAMLATCDHTIIDYGTYGDWGAFMAGGHTISLNTDKHFNEVMANFTDKWHVFQHKDFARNGENSLTSRIKIRYACPDSMIIFCFALLYAFRI